MENIATIQEHFMSNLPQLAGFNEPQMRSFISMFTNSDIDLDITTAACSIAKQSYLFSHISRHEIGIINQSTYSFAAFRQLLHPDDRMHLEEAVDMAYQFIKEKQLNEFVSLELCFECRFKNIKGNYQRVMLCYSIRNCLTSHKPEILSLSLFLIGSFNIDNPSRAIYIVDKLNGDCLLHNNKQCLTENEINLMRLLKVGYSRNEIAEKQSVSINVVYKRFSSIKRKTRCTNGTTAYLYLRYLDFL